MILCPSAYRALLQAALAAASKRLGVSVSNLERSRAFSNVHPEQSL